ncbi:MAG: SLC13 family permease [Alphaproteobacteria bacterium]|nr:SLC13 family permease [Alphaproteobacteria bacterium]MBU0796449.1 SLC13 family permease [Alphaproteobacteria bacterium]MBU0888665.1 SLC13 family permease [Alphaproteobacteria bacterium]MBU1813601.1 SLC13 family permease [Alphaproteobacteria bacterium]MBU2089832.1 SLC13 family permease [Alphaproteobacteria bacterium]
MTTEIILICALLVIAMGLFIWGRFRYDIVAFATLMAATALGLVPAADAFLGFGHPATITVAAVLIISRGLSNTGVVDMLAAVIQPASKRVITHIGAFSGTAAVLSAFMNNVGALALMMPAAIQSALAAKRSPALLLMPLSFGAILGGLVTLIGTPPNIIIATYRAEIGEGAFTMFDFTPVGGIVAVTGIAFIMLIGWRLIPKERRSASSTEMFDIENYMTEMNVTEKSSIVGKSFHELESEIEEIDAVVIGLARGNRFILSGRRDERLQPGDVLLIEASPEAIGRVSDVLELALPGDKGEAESEEEEEDDENVHASAFSRLSAENMTLLEAVVAQNSPLEGRTPALTRMRRRFGVNLLAVSRQGKPYRGRLRSFRFQIGDVLLLQGETDHLPDIVQELGCLPLAPRKLLGASRRLAWATIGIFAGAIIASSFNLIDLTVALGIAAILLVAMGSVRPLEIYESVDWPVIVLLGAMIPVGAALETTGATEFLAQAMVDLTFGAPPVVILALLMVVTMTLSDIMNNAATALVMAPISVGIARTLEVSADPFLMTVAIAASCAFLTPIGHQNNALIMGPGGYKFGDYWRLGLPLEILILIVSLPAILYFWPL